MLWPNAPAVIAMLPKRLSAKRFYFALQKHLAWVEILHFLFASASVCLVGKAIVGVQEGYTCNTRRGNPDHFRSQVRWRLPGIRMCAVCLEQANLRGSWSWHGDSHCPRVRCSSGSCSCLLLSMYSHIANSCFGSDFEEEMDEQRQEVGSA